MAIKFFNEDVKFNLQNKRILKSWLSILVTSENYIIGNLNYIFCSDMYLLDLNKDHLKHDSFTDIITFDNSDIKDLVEADIFISVDRVKENAQEHSVNFQTELLRVLSHGIFHLMGYKDKTKKEAQEMRNAEERAIELYNSLDVPRETYY